MDNAPKKLKILIISDAWHPQVNGVVRTYEHLSEELTQLGHTVKVIGPADFPRTIPTPGYPEIKLAIASYKRLKALTQDFAPNRIHIATEGPLGWAGRKYCRKHGREFSTSFHSCRFYTNPHIASQNPSSAASTHHPSS